MKKFWRSGMIDKKVIIERERKEYINKLQRTIFELSKPDIGDLINDIEPLSRDIMDKPLTPAQSAKKWGEGVKALFTGEYDEVRKGNGEVILDFYKPRFDKPKETNMDNMLDWMAKNLRDHPHYDRYDADIAFDKKMTLNDHRKAHRFKEK